MKVTLVAGARPNFMKIAPIIHEIQKMNKGKRSITFRLVHTGQHYDEKMSQTFFNQLSIPTPDANLGCGGGTQAEQTAAIMIAFEKEMLEYPSDIVLVVGDVTSTMACSIVAKKLNIRVAHVEAGIRSGDQSMPEEINRIVTDSITDYFFTTTPRASNNLRKLGVPDDRIFWVGNVMIDTLLANRKRFRKPEIWKDKKLKEGKFLVMTMHRPANVDEAVKLGRLLEHISNNAQGYPIIFPMHPRTRKIFEQAEIRIKNIYPIEPLGYLEFNFLVEKAKGVLTDSGGITEETTVMGVPCITLRDNTERPETVEIGTNILVGIEEEAIYLAMGKLLAGNWKIGKIPEKWDGKAASRIVKILNNINE